MMIYFTCRDETREERRKLSTNIANITRAIAERGHTQALLDRLTDLEARRAVASTEYAELEIQHYAPAPILTTDQITELSSELIRSLSEVKPELSRSLSEVPTDKTRQILRALVHKIVAKKDAGLLVGSITYFAPSPSPPFEIPLLEGRGEALPIGCVSTGAPLYRQTFTHPISDRVKAIYDLTKNFLDSKQKND